MYPRREKKSFIDLTGQKFGELTVVSYRRYSNWLCICSCGKNWVVRSHLLKDGTTKSCGCMKGLLISRSLTKHGMTKTSEYQIWRGMRRRCRDPNLKEFSDYGARGIFVCDRWEDFKNFYADMGPRPFPRATLDRIDNDGPYSPENCRWATYTEQASNRRSNVIFTLNGVSDTLQGWSRRLDIDPVTLASRRKRGWSDEDTLTKPVKKPEKKLTAKIEHNGQVKTVEEWASECGINKHALSSRIFTYKWPVEKALRQPPLYTHAKKKGCPTNEDGQVRQSDGCSSDDRPSQESEDHL